ncbi:hypothetical protein KL86DPRO_50009 [uncultured delta proteobacterium]|uniref:Uncharacterized protein n=1 Tax=uncultured delta proteobacterium TaxID=34034 RepID=A0A212KBH0_9DELT|nr:hypothetical protein KL86DPRO_50009 [uncultured delta proteobacterium]
MVIYPPIIIDCRAITAHMKQKRYCFIYLPPFENKPVYPKTVCPKGPHGVKIAFTKQMEWGHLIQFIYMQQTIVQQIFKK